MEPKAFAASMPVEKIDAKHPDYAAALPAWNDIDLLCQGGHTLRAQASRFLQGRPKELKEVYAARVAQFVYQPIIGPALGWYQTATFNEDPVVAITKTGGGEPEDFYPAFLKNCNRNQTGFIDLWRNSIYPSLLQFGSAWVLTDLPSTDKPASSLEDQRLSGALDPYVVTYDPRAVINWDTDEDGSMRWAVVSTSTDQVEFGSGPISIDRWYYFDKQSYAIYEARRSGKDKPETASLVKSGLHALADKNRVPLCRYTLPERLWLADRAYLHVLAHLNLHNAYYWGLTQGCLPVLYVKGDYDEPPTRSEVGYIKLPADGDIGYVEPSGSTYEITSKELAAAREEIYRSMWLQSQGRSSSASASSQSGYSKEMDMAPSQDVLNGFGRLLRQWMTTTLTDVADVRGDDVQIEVRGFDFDDADVIGELEGAQLAQDLDIPSDTLTKEVQKRVARTLLRGASPEVVKTVDAEIDASDSAQARKDKAEAQRRERLRGSLMPAVPEQKVA